MESWVRLLKVTNKFAKYSVLAMASATVVESSNNVHHVCCSRSLTRLCHMGSVFTVEKRPERRLLRVNITSEFTGSSLLLPCLAIPCYISAFANPYCSVTPIQSSVDKTLNNLMLKHERLGQLNRNDLSRAVSKLEQQRDHLSDDHCCQLLEAGVRVAQMDFRPCSKLIQRIWHLTINRPYTKLTLKHFELYLEACLLTETPCTIEDITPILKKHGLVADGRLFGLVLGVAGVMRDTDAAVATVITMKEKGIPATQDTFASLLMAYAASSDKVGVESVEEAMKNAKVSDSSSTLAALIIGYAWAGQIAAMKQVAARARQLGVTIPQAQLSVVLLALARAGHTGQNYCHLNWVIEVMDEVGSGENAEVELSHAALKMIHADCMKEAFHLVCHFPTLTTSSHLYSNAAVYVQEAVRACKDLEIIVEVCSKLAEEGITQYGLYVALECALREKREEPAWVFLHALKQSGRVLREHYVWPLLAGATSAQQILMVVKGMLDLDVKPGIETLKDYILPGLLSGSTAPSMVSQQLQHVGLPEQVTATPILLTLIRKNAFDCAAKFVAEAKVNLSLRDLVPTLASSWPSRPRAVTALLAVLIKKHAQRQQQVNSKESNGEEDWGGQFVLDLASTRQSIGAHQIQPLFEELKRNEIGISEYSVELLLARSNLGIQEAIKRSASLIVDPTLGHPPLEKDSNLLPHPKTMNVEELDGHLVELKAKGLNKRGTLRKLMLAQASLPPTAPANTTATSVLDLQKQVSEEGMKMSAGMLASVLKAQVKNGEADAALQTLATLRAHHQTFHLDHYKVIDLCTLLIKEHRGHEAVETLRQQLIEEVKNGNRAEAKTNPKRVRRNCWALLMASAETCDYDLTRNLLNLLLTRGLVFPDTLVLGCLVRCRLARCSNKNLVKSVFNIMLSVVNFSGDLAGAVEETEDIMEQYKCLPMRIETLIHLIHSCGEDGRSTAISGGWSLIHRLVSLIAHHYGSSQAHHDLCFACLEADRPTVAAEVLKKLGDDVDMWRIKKQVEYYAKTQRDLPMLHLLTATSRTTQAIDRYYIYSTLLDLYSVMNDADRGLALWTRMQEEGTVPTQAFLTTLAALLTNHQRQIPFTLH